MKLIKQTTTILFVGLVLLSACKEKSNSTTAPVQGEEVISEKKQEIQKEETTSAYACPMDCEDGKTYAEAGTCPVCKMDLALLKTEEVQKGDQSMHGKKGKHSKKKMCQCKKGECKCKKGECKCGTPGYDHVGNKV